MLHQNQWPFQFTQKVSIVLKCRLYFSMLLRCCTHPISTFTKSAQQSSNAFVGVLTCFRWLVKNFLLLVFLTPGFRDHSPWLSLDVQTYDRTFQCLCSCHRTSWQHINLYSISCQHHITFLPRLILLVLCSLVPNGLSCRSSCTRQYHYLIRCCVCPSRKHQRPRPPILSSVGFSR